MRGHRGFPAVVESVGMDPHLTVQETAETLGVSTKTIQRRIERGTVQSFRRDGRRLIPAVEVERLRQIENPGGGGVFPGVHGGTPVGDLSAVLARLEELAAENGRFRALQEVNENDRARLEGELLEARSTNRTLELQVAALEAAAPKPRWWRKKPEGADASGS